MGCSNSKKAVDTYDDTLQPGGGAATPQRLTSPATAGGATPHATTYTTLQQPLSPGQDVHLRLPPPTGTASPVSGSYRGPEVELRVDVDAAVGDAVVLRVVSGDLFAPDSSFRQSFVAADVAVAPAAASSDGNVVVTGHARYFGGTRTAALRLVITGATAALTLGTLSFPSLRRYSPAFRHITLEVDYDTAASPAGVPSVAALLPVFNPADHPTRPVDLPLGDRSVASVFADAGVAVSLDTLACNRIADPDPTSAWLTSELHQAMQLNAAPGRGRGAGAGAGGAGGATANNSGQGGDPNEWRVWMLLARQFRSSRTAGLMFDAAHRKGFAVFQDHPWFVVPDGAGPTAAARAARQLLHTVVHELGHVLGLRHPWEEGGMPTLSWMTYDWVYNQQHGPDAYYAAFRYAFTRSELMHLRHGNRTWLFPSGPSPGVTVASPTRPPVQLTGAALPSDPDTNDAMARRVQLLARVQPGYDTMEVVQLELRLRNAHTARITLDGRLDLAAGTVHVYVVRPSGSVVQVQPVVRSATALKRVRLEPAAWAAGSGADRFSVLLGLAYSASGFLFREAGKYNVQATYDFGEYHLVSNVASFHVHPYSGDPALPDIFFRPLMGEYLALGGSLAPRFDPVRKLLLGTAGSYTSQALPRWLLSALVFTAPGTLARGRVMTPTPGSGVTITHVHPDQEAMLEVFDRVLESLHTVGTPTDNLLYVKATKMMAELLQHMGRSEDAVEAIDNCLEDLATRGVKQAALDRVRRKLLRAAGMPAPPSGLPPGVSVAQARVNDLLQWATDVLDPVGAAVSTGTMLLGEEFSTFDARHTELAATATQQVWAAAEDCGDLMETLGFIEDMMKGGVYNRQLVQHVLEVFVVHHPLSHAAGLRLEDHPEPFQLSEEAARSSTSPPDPRFPQERDMDYFRNDHEFNFHHRHWHAVYNSAGVPGSNGTRRHLDRQGELFVYMHTAMLARYNADRVSWNLPDTVPYDLTEREPLGFFHSAEFHRSRVGGRGPYSSRPANQRWPEDRIKQFVAWTQALRGAIVAGFLRKPAANGDGDITVPLTRDWFGHALEATTGSFSELYGNLHNMGHGVFGRITDGGRRGPMSSSVAAVRDPIFFRWHTFVDKLVEEYGDSYAVDVGAGLPPVTVDGVVLQRVDADAAPGTVPTPPAGFADVRRNNWAQPASNFTSHDMLTTLGKPMYAWEFGKLTHRPFAYHFRVSRNRRRSSAAMALTARVFMCPEGRIENRHSWIEMDKFRFDIPEGVNHHVVSRRDVFSSVIRRTPDIAAQLPDDEGQRVRGFCECGWPYDMLLPRGTNDGMKFVWFVMVTDNNLDTMGVCTECGSLSFCGTRDRKYPDAKEMGYPFASKLTLDGVQVSVADVMQNRDTRWGATDHPSEAELAAAAAIAAGAGAGAGTSGGAAESKGAEDDVAATGDLAPAFVPAWSVRDVGGVRLPLSFFNSAFTGAFRVFLSAEDFVATGAVVRLRFRGRTDGQPATIHSVSIARRAGLTDHAQQVSPVLFGGRGWGDPVVVPPVGVESDPVDFDLDGTSHVCVSFAATEPTWYQPHARAAARGCIIARGGADMAQTARWVTSSLTRRSYVYGLEAVLVSSDTSSPTANVSADAASLFV